MKLLLKLVPFLMLGIVGTSYGQAPQIVTPLSDEEVVCNYLAPDFKRIYELFRQDVEEPLTYEIVVMKDNYQPLQAFPLAVAVETIYSFTAEQVDILTESWWISSAIDGCIQIIGEPLYNDRWMSLVRDETRRWISTDSQY